jgi:hypothetical protein
VKADLTALANAPVDRWWKNDLLCGGKAVDICSLLKRTSTKVTPATALNAQSI